MKDIFHRQKKKYNISILIIIFCLFSYTLGQFIPIYFIDSSLRMYFYVFILILLLVTIIWTVFKIVYKPNEYNVFSTALISLLIGLITFIVFGFWTIFLFLGVWAQAGTYYVKKSNPQIKIISRYVNLGATGGGTESEDFHIVLHRPILFLFKMETAIDTMTINKNEWIRLDN